MIRHCRKYRNIANRLIRTLPEFDELLKAGPRVAYLQSSKEKVKNRRTVFADCTKTDERYSWCCPYDFFITVYSPNVENFTEEQMEILIQHELHHIGITYTDSGVDYFVRPHDIEDFRMIIDRFGLDWSTADAAG